MNAQSSISNSDKLKWFGAAALLVAGVSGFYALPMDQKLIRVGAVILSVLVAGALIAVSAQGRQFIDYARDSVKEAEKVVWPDKKETWQVTGLVFLFAFTLALFMWVVDSGLTWLFYDVLLGRG